MKTTLYVAERIRTLDAARPLARALAVRGDRVLAVGSREEVLSVALRVYAMAAGQSVDPVEDAASALVEARVLATVVAGVEVFRA